MATTVKKLEDPTVTFSTTDGIDELSGINAVSTTNSVIGKDIVLTNGNITWNDVYIVSYVYVYDADDGAGFAHYAYSEGIFYKNGAVVGSHPIEVTATGILGVTGMIRNITIFNEVKSSEWVQLDFERESYYW